MAVPPLVRDAEIEYIATLPGNAVKTNIIPCADETGVVNDAVVEMLKSPNCALVVPKTLIVQIILTFE